MFSVTIAAPFFWLKAAREWIVASLFWVVICHLSPGPVRRYDPFKSCKGVVRYVTVETHFYLVYPVDCRL